MIILKKVDALFKEAAEYFYESRGIINSDFDTKRFKLYDYEKHSLKTNREEFKKWFCYNVYMNLKIYREKLTFVVSHLTYVNQGKLEGEILENARMYLFNCDNLANTEMYSFMKQIKPKIENYQGPVGPVRKPRKSPGRPKEKTRKAKLSADEAAQLFFILANTGVIPSKTKTELANDMNLITGWNVQDSRAGMSFKEGLTQESKDKIIKLLEEAIESVKTFSLAKKEEKILQ